MHLTSLLVLASSASAITMPNFLDLAQLFPRKSSACPSVWSSISSELTQNFLSGRQCNANARAAIRAVFHDCGGKPLISVSPPRLIYSHKTTAWQTSLGANNGCDGSLATADELGRSENRGLTPIVTYLQNLAKSYKVSVADMIGKLASPFLQPPSSLTHPPQSSPATTPSSPVPAVPASRPTSDAKTPTHQRPRVSSRTSTRRRPPSSGSSKTKASTKSASPPSSARTPPQRNSTSTPLTPAARRTRRRASGTSSTTGRRSSHPRA
jgi:hypothetical protein